MVCEREPDSPYDPRAGRIHVVRDGDWLRAEGTTLGADDGVAIAAMLARRRGRGRAARPAGAADDRRGGGRARGRAGARPGARHRRRAAQPRQRGGRRADDRLRGERGPRAAASTRRASRCAAGADLLRVTVRGGRGGHSGGDIAAGRANAIKLLAPRAARRGRGPHRGVRRRREPQRDPARRGRARARATACGPRSRPRTPRRAAPTPAPTRACGSTAEPAGADPAADAWTAAASARLLDLVALLPAGPLAMSPDFPGLVETSSSVGVAGTAGRHAHAPLPQPQPGRRRAPRRPRPDRGGRPARRRDPRVARQLPRVAAGPGRAAAGHRRRASTPGCSAPSRRSAPPTAGSRPR